MLQEPERESPCIGQLGGVDARALGAEENGKVVSDFRARLHRYGIAKDHTLRLAGALGVERLRDMGVTFPRRVIECGDYLKWRDYFTRTGADRFKLAAASLCGYPLVCGLCARTRAGRNTRAYSDKFEAVRLVSPELFPHMVTFTVRNGDDLRERFDHLRDCLRRLLERRTRKGASARSSVMHEVAGGVYSFEVTNIGNGWHPHVHAIFLSRFDFASAVPDLHDEWKSITGDSHVLDVRPILPEPAGIDGVSDYAHGFREVLKYAMKAAELGPELIAQAYPVLAGRRLLGSFGVLRGVKLADTGLDDLAGLEDLPYIEFMSRFDGGRYFSEVLP